MQKNNIYISMRLGQVIYKLERHPIQFSHHNKNTNIIQNLSWFGKRLLSLSMKCLPGCMWWSATTMVVLYAKSHFFSVRHWKLSSFFVIHQEHLAFDSWFPSMKILIFKINVFSTWKKVVHKVKILTGLTDRWQN